MLSADEKKIIDQETRDIRKQVALEAAAMSFGDAGAKSTEELIARATKLYDWLTPIDAAAHMKVVDAKREG